VRWGWRWTVHDTPFLAFFSRRVFTSSQTDEETPHSFASFTSSLAHPPLVLLHTDDNGCGPSTACLLKCLGGCVGGTNAQRPWQNLGYKCSYDSCQRLRWTEIQPPMWFLSWFSPISHVDLRVLGPVCSLPDMTAQFWLHGSVSQHRLSTPSEDRLLGSVNLA
jgi:hypothetical protein